MLKKELTDRQALVLLLVCSSLVGGKSSMDDPAQRIELLDGASRLADAILGLP